MGISTAGLAGPPELTSASDSLYKRLSCQVPTEQNDEMSNLLGQVAPLKVLIAMPLIPSYYVG